MVQNLNTLVMLRRDIHRYPEVGFTEFRTASLIASRLGELNYSVRLGADVMTESQRLGVPALADIEDARRLALASGSDPALIEAMGAGLTGVVAEMRRGDGPVVALRFDIDALPVQESGEQSHVPLELGFASTRPGYMHACGHDGHAAIGLSVAEGAASLDANWRGTLRLIFQPAEEGGRGAWPMVHAGVVDDVNWFFALHLGCDLPSGKVASRATDMMFSSKWDAEFRGKSAHAAGNPELGRNALLAAAQAAIGLHAMPRHGRHATHVNVGAFHAGSSRNTVSDFATLGLELRAAAGEALSGLEIRARQVIEGSAITQGCSATLRVQGRTIGEEATPAAADVVAEAARKVSRSLNIIDSWPIGGGDDAAFFMKRVIERGGQAGYFIVGSDLNAGHHQSSFDFVEADMEVASEIILKLVELLSADSH